MKIELENKVALVIGGTGTLGTAICKQLTEAGARVATDFSGRNGVDEWQIKLAESGINISPFMADISDFDDCMRMVDEIESTIGPIDIIVNSYELGESLSFNEIEINDWEKTMSNSIDGLYNVCKNVADRMTNRGHGRIINISSIISRMGSKGHSHIAAAMSGVHGFSMALAQEVGRKGVTVNTVSPGKVSNLQDGITDAEATMIPAGRLCTPEEVAYLVEFLCSDQAAYINGADIPVNGGQYIH